MRLTTSLKVLISKQTDLGVTLPSPHIAFGGLSESCLSLSEGFASTNGVDWTSDLPVDTDAINGWESTDDGVHFTGVGGFLRGMHISYDDGATRSNMHAGMIFKESNGIKRLTLFSQ